jgi:hypothetical protein
MGISDRLSQLLPGTQPPVEDERLLQLYWNRAELKKELSRLQTEHLRLLEQVKKHEGAAARAREQFDELERYLGDPDVATHALVYFQLRGLWRACALRLSRFGQQLQAQQHDRERRRQLIDFDQLRRRHLAESEQRVTAAREAAGSLEAQLKLAEARLASLRGFWNYFRRRGLAEEVTTIRGNWDAAATRVTDLSDDLAEIEGREPPAFSGISIDGKRTVNTAVIAYALQLASLLSNGGLAALAKEATSKRVFDMNYGGRDDCVRLMTLLREGLRVASEEGENLVGLAECTSSLQARAGYRGDADTVPLTDSIGTLSLPPVPAPGLSTPHLTGINVLVDDYWDLNQTLLR